MDALLIPVFILLSLIIPVLLPALLLYAIPVWAAITVVLKGKRQEQVLVISWGIFGIRTSGTGAGRLTEVLLAGHAVLSHSGFTEKDGKAGEENRAGGVESGEVPAGGCMPGPPSGPPSGPPCTQPNATAMSTPSLSEPRSSGALAAVEPDQGMPVTGALAAAGIPVTGTPAPGSPDIGEIVHVIQKMIAPVGSFGSAFWQQSRFVDASGTVTLGLGDPALTGEICGMYWASRFALLASRIYVELEPVFDRAVLELDITVRMKVKHPLLVLLAGFTLAWHPAIREAMGIAMRRSRGAAPA